MNACHLYVKCLIRASPVARLCAHKCSNLQDEQLPLWITPRTADLTPSVDVPANPQQLFIDGPGDCSAADASSSALVVSALSSAEQARQATVQEWACGACGIDSGAAVVLPLSVVFPQTADLVRSCSMVQSCSRLHA